MNNKLKNKISLMPHNPGVYLMYDSSAKVIYVGKAKNLRKRLVSYLAAGVSSKTAALMKNVFDIECRIMPTETMALLVEASLIHKLQPKYNISLRDDKSFFCVGITVEDFPRVVITRKKDNLAGRLFGPYVNSKLLRSALKVIRKAFPYRSCNTLSNKPCIYSRINLCPAPCLNRVTKGEYAEIIENIILILEGKVEFLINKLTKLMQIKSKSHDFEAAARLRDQIDALSVFGVSSFDNPGHQAGLDGLRKLLGLKKIPHRIEGFDISNISGQEAVGSMVSFFNGSADKKNYRRFRIKSVLGPDDYKMLEEVLERRYRRLLKEKTALPDLILIDGGKGHLLVAQGKLKELGLDIPLISIAKAEENIYIKGRSNPIRFDSDTAVLNLIRWIRDEAHRFAVNYHHILRRKKIIGR